jgi:two-component system NtrC family response regulator
MLDDTDIPVIESGCGKQDIYLPGFDGWTLIGMIREVSPQVPVIAISAILPAELAAKYRTTGFTGYITKPFEMNRLKEIIVSYLHYPVSR